LLNRLCVAAPDRDKAESSPTLVGRGNFRTLSDRKSGVALVTERLSERSLSRFAAV
jgi:hypothetical protein